MADDMLNKDGTLNTDRYYYRPGTTEPELRPEFVNAAPPVLDAPVETSAAEPKKGKLPDDFPHAELLRGAGITTYAKARDLQGDYSSVEGIGEARGKEIDLALE